MKDYINKNSDCIFYEPIIDSRYVLVAEGSFRVDHELKDEVCWVDPDNPKHHNEYSCEGCPFYKKK